MELSARRPHMLTQFQRYMRSKAFTASRIAGLILFSSALQKRSGPATHELLGPGYRTLDNPSASHRERPGAIEARNAAVAFATIRAMEIRGGSSSFLRNASLFLRGRYASPRAQPKARYPLLFLSASIQDYSKSVLSPRPPHGHHPYMETKCCLALRQIV
jgi:hypothetical protein